jgi:streptogramin lyase
MPVRKLAALLGTALALPLALCSPAVAAPHFEAGYKVGQFSNNSKLVEGADHNMWLTIEAGGKDVARITPSGQVTEYAIKAAAAPVGIAAGPEGRLWITFNKHVASFLPADPEGSAQETEIGDVENDASIVAGPDGQMWIATKDNLIHFDPADPAKAKSIPIAEFSPRDIDVAGSVFAIAATLKAKNVVLTATTAGAIAEFPVKGQSQGVAGNAAGQIGFSQQGTMPTEVGVFTPPNTTPVTSEVPAVDPFGIALGSDTAFWAARKGGAQRFTASGESTFISGANEDLFVRQVASGPDNTIWITMLNGGENIYEVGKISGLEPPVKPKEEAKPPAPPETTIGKGPKKKVTTKAKKAQVTFRFSSTAAAATFECALVKKPKKKGKKAPKPKFSACKSPHKLKLKPGKYTFSVRAVLGGVADPSPATSAFRVVRVK